MQNVALNTSPYRPMSIQNTVTRQSVTQQPLPRFEGRSGNRTAGLLGTLAMAAAMLIAGGQVPAAPVPAQAPKPPAKQEPQPEPKPAIAQAPMPELSPEEKAKLAAEEKLQDARKKAMYIERHFIRLGKTNGDNIEALTREVLRVLNEDKDLKIDAQTREKLVESAKLFSDSRKALADSGIIEDFPMFGDFQVKDDKQREALQQYIQRVAMNGYREMSNLLRPVSPNFRADPKRAFWSDEFPLPAETREALKRDKAVQKCLTDLELSGPALSLAHVTLQIDARHLKEVEPTKTPFTGRLNRDYLAKPFVE